METRSNETEEIALVRRLSSHVENLPQNVALPPAVFRQPMVYLIFCLLNYSETSSTTSGCSTVINTPDAFSTSKE